MRALVYGEVIWDVYPDKKVIGGAPFNFSAHLSHLGDEAYLVSAIGEDELGNAALKEMHRHGIKTDFIQENGFSTGACTVTLDGNKIPCYNVHRDTAYDNIEITDDDIQRINCIGADVFYFNTLIQRSEVSRNSLHKVLKNCKFDNIFCDINIRKDCFDFDSLKLCMQSSTIVKISDEEAHYLYETSVLKEDGLDFVHSVKAQYPNIKTIVYTMGANGSAVLDTENDALYESGKPEAVEVVSTVGAGDCFGATFLSSFMSGDTIPVAIQKATLRSNIVVSSLEAVPFA